MSTLIDFLSMWFLLSLFFSWLYGVIASRQKDRNDESGR
jgi:hypothetical protein